MNETARGYPAGSLRVSDADRDAALAELSEHFETGRLTSDELDERIGRAIRARTGQDLADLMADLPAAGRGQPNGTGTGAGLGGRRRLTAALVVTLAAVVTAAIVAASLTRSHGHGFVVPGWVILAAFIAWRQLAPRSCGRSRGRRSRPD
jgi:Domain of unknown function (DUF1707)